MVQRRVVVTGLGALTPLGLNVKDSWQGLKEGKSGAAPVTHLDASAFNTRFSMPVKGFNAEDYMSAKEARKMDLFIQYGMAAGIQAFRDSGLEVTEQNAGRIGVIVGAGIGGLYTIEKNHDALLEGGPRKMSPFFVPGSIVNMIAGNLSIEYGLRGPNLAVVTACTTGAHCIGHGARVIAYGDADVMVAGGAEMATTNLGLGGFGAARALSTRNDAPEKASRPWDRDRDGFVLGDGAGVIVLEEYEHAKKRGAKIYAELIGFGMSGDAYHMTSPPEDGSGAALSMANAIRDAGLRLEDIDYVNAHGTSTKAGDLAETRAIKSVFGDQAYKVPVSSTKSMTGHLLGAAGSVEAIVAIMAIQDNVLPPTINLDNPDEGCDLDYVPHTARDTKVNIAMSNSFGFGGTNGTLIFKRV
ncbi:beta-ketoacyl-ACP synthase II [Permianibacter aggregans]|uniref:3-oxoacyl-[acyl-carrier-protein] synthase 2 n=1 Tax=Permianibacter aggregans TaxID=1510150 RepID=A0A4R6UVA0_9GAMM|nr:beta-ketoacyl-ACP synthase II [Permianibacter aggregans]QGX41468.1 beta-ketoacyl-[acyl-carrier-protein] synthase II [Permianibacter aggregans]TDQ51260.1 3-oxoacyl-[acyl-carrier-protein] synthase II [Permianibacter aggregans]